MNVATCFGTAMFLCKYAHTSQAVGDARDLLKISKKLNTLENLDIVIQKILTVLITASCDSKYMYS